MKISHHQEEKVSVFLCYQWKFVGIILFLKRFSFSRDWSLGQSVHICSNWMSKVDIKEAKCSYMWKIKTQNPVQKPQKYWNLSENTVQCPSKNSTKYHLNSTV